MALGARPGDIILLVVRQGLTLTLGGVAIGLLGAIAVTRILSVILYGIARPTS